MCLSWSTVSLQPCPHSPRRRHWEQEAVREPECPEVPGLPPGPRARPVSPGLVGDARGVLRPNGTCLGKCDRPRRHSPSLSSATTPGTARGPQLGASPENRGLHRVRGRDRELRERSRCSGPRAPSSRPDRARSPQRAHPGTRRSERRDRPDPLRGDTAAEVARAVRACGGPRLRAQPPLAIWFIGNGLFRRAGDE